MTAGRGALIALDSAIAAVIATATRSLPEPSTPDEKKAQAALLRRLLKARASIDELLHPQSPARRDQPSTSAGAVATTGGPVHLIPVRATPNAWGRTSW